MIEKYAEIAKKPPKLVSQRRGPVDMAVYPNGTGSRKPIDGSSLVQQIREIRSLDSQDARRIRRRRRFNF